MVTNDGWRRPASRRTVLRGVLAGMAAGGLAGCSGGKGLPADQASGGGSTTLQWWTNHTAFDEKLFKEAIKRFNTAEAGITVKLLNIADFTEYYTKLKAAAVAKQLPDVFYARTFDTASNAAKGWQRPLEDLVAKDPGAAALEDIWPVLKVQMTYRDKLYSLPYNLSDYGLYYNKSMFDEVGVDPPADTWTWDDVWAAAAAFPQRKGNRQTRWGVAWPFDDWYILSVIKSNGGESFDASGRPTLDNPVAVETLRTFQDKMKSGVAPSPSALPQGINPFQAGMVAMNIGGSWDTGATREGVGKKFDWDVAKLPLGSTGKRQVLPAGGAWGIAANAADPEVAWKFVTFLAADAQLQLLISEQGSIPGRPSSADRWLTEAKKKTPPNRMEVFTDQLKQDTWNLSYPPYWGEFQTIYSNRIDALTSGEDPAKLLRAIQDDTAKASARYT